jgi:hypothetical protein
MDSFDRLVQFIDRYTENGTEELPQIFGEGVGAEAAGLICLSQFLDRDWGQLPSYWLAQSDLHAMTTGSPRANRTLADGYYCASINESRFNTSLQWR